jgi:hypothetical protein
MGWYFREILFAKSKGAGVPLSGLRRVGIAQETSRYGIGQEGKQGVGAAD